MNVIHDHDCRGEGQFCECLRIEISARRKNKYRNLGVNALELLEGVGDQA